MAHVHDTRPDSGPGLLRADEGTSAAPRDIATDRKTVGHRVSTQIAIGGCRLPSLGMLPA